VCYPLMRGRDWIAFAANSTDPRLPHKLLSNREYPVFNMLVAGLGLTEIAEDLCLSIKTISTHKTHIMEKMHLTNFAELIHYAIAHQLAEPAEFRV